MALEELFRELRTRWLIDAASSAVTNERVLRELTLPPDAETRLCYFSVSTPLLSFYRDAVFPSVNRMGLVPAAGDEIDPWLGDVQGLRDALLFRAHAVVGDTSRGDPRVLYDLRAAAQRDRPPRIAVIRGASEQSEVLAIPNAQVIVRPDAATDIWPSDESTDGDGGTWLEELLEWLDVTGAGTAARLEHEPLRLLDQGEYRAAVVASSSAIEVVLRENLEARWQEASKLVSPRERRGPAGFGRLIQWGEELGMLTRRTERPYVSSNRFGMKRSIPEPGSMGAGQLRLSAEP